MSKTLKIGIFRFLEFFTFLNLTDRTRPSNVIEQCLDLIGTPNQLQILIRELLHQNFLVSSNVINQPVLESLRANKRLPLLDILLGCELRAPILGDLLPELFRVFVKQFCELLLSAVSQALKRVDVASPKVSKMNLKFRNFE